MLIWQKYLDKYQVLCLQVQVSTKYFWISKCQVQVSTKYSRFYIKYQVLYLTPTLPNILVKKKWISEFHRTNPLELKCWSPFYVNYFLRYYLMMLFQSIVKRVNGDISEHTGLISPFQHLIIAACTNTGGQIKSSHPRPADSCPFVLRHTISQVTSFMQLGMLCCL